MICHGEALVTGRLERSPARRSRLNPFNFVSQRRALLLFWQYSELSSKTCTWPLIDSPTVLHCILQNFTSVRPRADSCAPGPVIATLSSMDRSVSLCVEEQEVLDRLSDRGIKPADYIEIKRIVSFDIPHGLLMSAQRFGRRSITQVMAQIEGWRRFLERDALFTDDEKGKVEHLLQGVEVVVGQALLEVNWLHIGPWILTGVWLPTGQDAQGQPEYLQPGLRLTAVHGESKQERSAVISGEELNDPSKRSGAWKRAFKELGIWDLVARDAVNQRVTRAGRPQGWPIFTRLVIPPLYEYLLPHYQKPGHHSVKRDTLLARKALFPKELFEDVLLILRFEHPGMFEGTTISQIRADIQRYLERKQAGNTKASK